MQFDFTEVIPRINTGQLYLILWVRTVEKLQDETDPYKIFRAVQVYYHSLLPPIRRRINTYYYRNQYFAMFNEINRVMEILAKLQYSNGKYLIDPSMLKKSEVKILLKYGSIYQAAGNTYYFPFALEPKMVIAALNVFGIITKVLYQEGVLTIKIGELTLGGEGEEGNEVKEINLKGD